MGRVSAQVNHAFNDYQKKNWGWFGFLEFEDDQEVLDGLLDAAEAWLRARGKERMVGPASFAMNDESGVLIEGYDLRPMILQPWNPPYYQLRLEQAGMTKAMDLLMWNLEVTDRDKVMPVIWELAEKVQPEHGIRVRPMRRRQLRKDMDAFAEVYNSAWSKNWDFVPLFEEGPRRLCTRAAAGVRQALVHDRRARRHGRGRGHGDDDPRPQPGA